MLRLPQGVGLFSSRFRFSEYFPQSSPYKKGLEGGRGLHMGKRGALTITGKCTLTQGVI